MYNDEWGNGWAGYSVGNVNSGSVKLPESRQSPADTKGLQPKVIINEDVYQKVMFWIKKAPGEVSGMGKVVYDVQRNELRVISAYLLKQKNTGTSTELDATAMGKLMFETRNDPGELRWWWHSHVDFGTFWSSTDMTTIKELGGQGWILATVLNKKEDKLSAFCQNAPVFMFVDKLDTTIDRRIDADLEKRWADEYDQKCEVVKYTSYSHDGASKATITEIKPSNDGRSVKATVAGQEVDVSVDDLVAYAEAFGVENIPPELSSLFPKEIGQEDIDEVDDNVDINKLKALGYVFDETDDSEQEAKKLDLIPVRKKKWPSFF